MTDQVTPSLSQSQVFLHKWGWLVWVSSEDFFYLRKTWVLSQEATWNYTMGPHILGVETLLLSLSSGVFSDHLLFVPCSWTVCVCLNVLEACSQSGHLYFTDVQNITQITSVLPDGFSQTKHTNKSFDQMKKQHYHLLIVRRYLFPFASSKGDV